MKPVGLGHEYLGWKSQGQNGRHPRVVENDQAKILWDFKIQTDKLVMANQPEIVLINKQQNMAVVIEVIYILLIYISIYIYIYIYI